MGKVPKSLKGRSRHRVLFLGPKYLEKTPFGENEKDPDTVWQSLSNMGYVIDVIDEYPDNGLRPQGLMEGEDYEGIIAWIYLPEGKTHLNDVVRLLRMNGWSASYYMPNQRGSVLRGVRR